MIARITGLPPLLVLWLLLPAAGWSQAARAAEQAPKQPVAAHAPGRDQDSRRFSGVVTDSRGEEIEGANVDIVALLHRDASDVLAGSTIAQVVGRGTTVKGGTFSIQAARTPAARIV